MDRWPRWRVTITFELEAEASTASVAIRKAKRHARLGFHDVSITRAEAVKLSNGAG
jgi:hypothetical protein